MATNEERFERAVQHHRMGRKEDAQAFYREVLSADPRHDRALYLSSVLALEAGRLEDALALLLRALEVTPDNPAYHTNLGEAYRRAGRLEEAAQALVRAVSLNPELAIPSFNLGIVLQALGQSDSAVQSFERCADLQPEKGVFQVRLAELLENRGQAVRALGHHQCALALMPGSAEVRRNLARALRRCGRGSAAGAIERGDDRRGRDPSGAASRETEAYALLDAGEKLSKQGRYEEAARALEKAAELLPELAEAHHNLGIVRSRQGARGEALRCFERATDYKPLHFQFQHLLARALDAHGEIPRAIGHYHAALVLDPISSEVLADLSGALRKLGRPAVALAMANRAVLLKKDVARVHTELGRSLGELNRWDEAVASCRRAVELDPNDASASHELGHVLLESGLIGEAVDTYRRTTELDATDVHAHSALMFAMSFDTRSSGEAILAEGRRFERYHCDPLLVHVRPHENERSPERRLRIGYVAPTFWDHVMSIFTLPLLKYRDREDFEVYCYASVSRPDAVTDEFRSHADAWRDVLGLDDIALAELVRRDEIDVLVDLNLHMGDARLRTFACRPAPVQVTYAFPATTGMACIDYRVADPHSEPPGVLGTERWNELYAERAIVVPDTYWCYDPRGREPEVSPLPALDGKGIRFGCLNALWKVNEQTARLWARVLAAVPGAKISLLAPGARMDLGRVVSLAQAQRRALDIFRSEGIDLERIEFLPRVSRRPYLEYYRSIDIGLDTLPYNGHTTSLDSYFMGVPVVTLPGDRVVGRAGYCYAKNLDLLELVANDEDDYVAIAARLAADLPRLSALRAGLRERLERSPLMDGKKFVRHLEDGYRSAWRAWCGDSDGANRSPRG